MPITNTGNSPMSPPLLCFLFHRFLQETRCLSGNHWKPSIPKIWRHGQACSTTSLWNYELLRPIVHGHPTWRCWVQLFSSNVVKTCRHLRVFTAMPVIPQYSAGTHGYRRQGLSPLIKRSKCLLPKQPRRHLISMNFKSGWWEGTLREVVFEGYYTTPPLLSLVLPKPFPNLCSVHLWPNSSPQSRCFWKANKILLCGVQAWISNQSESSTSGPTYLRPCRDLNCTGLQHGTAVP